MSGRSTLPVPPSQDAPFAGLKVVDLGQGLASPYCGALMAQHGADVVKVEPLHGDWSRLLGGRHGDQTAFSIAANQGKRSIALDVKSPEGSALLWRLLDGAHVLIEGFRPGVMQRLGFSFAEVAARDPALVYVSISGFGQNGSFSQRPAMDPVLQAYTGLTYDNRGSDGIPRRVPISVVDMAAALYAFQALAPALYVRSHLGTGRHIDCSLLQSAAAFQTVRLIAAALDGDAATVSIPPSGAYATCDGWIQLQIVQDRDWKSFCQAIRHEALANDDRFATRELRLRNDALLESIVRPALATFNIAELMVRLKAADLMYQEVHTHERFLQEANKVNDDILKFLELPDSSKQVPLPTLPGLSLWSDARARPPRCGEHTREILDEHGYTAQQIAALERSGAVRQTV